MKYREKLGYIALGGVLMLVGMLAAGLSSPIGAVNNAPDAVFGTITCRELKVVEADGVERVRIRTLVPGNSGLGSGGMVSVMGKGGQEQVNIVGIDDDGGAVSVMNKDETAQIHMDTDKNGGRIFAFGRNGTTIMESGQVFVNGKIDDTGEIGTNRLRPERGE